MNIDQLLSIWSQHNITIIESLIALVILLSLFLAFRGFFGSDAKNEKPQMLGEKTSAGTAHEKGTLHGDAAALVDDIELEDITPSSSADHSAQLEEKDKTIAQLESEIQALKNAEAPVAAVDTSQLEAVQGQVQELERRLSEYEILSEDLADLSRLKKENEDLKKQLEALKQGVGEELASAPIEAVVETELLAEEAPVSEPVAEAVTEEISEDLQEQIETLADQNVEVTGGKPEVVAETMTLETQKDESYVDDEFMAEFQEAVLAQKNLDKNAESIGKEKIAVPEVKAQEIDAEDIDMLNQFGEFTEKKKS